MAQLDMFDQVTQHKQTHSEPRQGLFNPPTPTAALRFPTQVGPLDTFPRFHAKLIYDA